MLFSLCGGIVQPWPTCGEITEDKGENHVALIVQKFGVTSVADAGKIQAAAQKAVAAKRAGHQVVMVVSAMGKNTDMLVDLASQVIDDPTPREMDMLLSTGEQVSVALMAMAIHGILSSIRLTPIVTSVPVMPNTTMNPSETTPPVVTARMRLERAEPSVSDFPSMPRK